MFLITQQVINLIVLGSVLLVILLLLVLFMFGERWREAQLQARFKKETETTQIFQIDLINNTVVFFSRSHIREKTEAGIDAFYSKFHVGERERINQWFYDLLAEKPDTPSYLEADLLNVKKKQPYFALLQTYKIDRDQKRIYLESTLLKSLLPNHKLPRQKASTLLTTEARMRGYFARTKNKPRGTTMVIRFYKLNFHQTSTLQTEHQLSAVLKDKVAPFLGNGRYLLAFSDLEIAIFDVKSLGRTMAMQIARTVSHEMAAYLALNGHKESYSFSIGISENIDFAGDYNRCIQATRETAIIAEAKKEKTNFYEPQEVTRCNENRQFAAEVEQVIKERSVTLNFRPIIDVASAKEMGYISYLDPVASVFNTLRELREYAYKTEQHRELFAMLAKKTIAKFAPSNVANGLKLFFEVSVLDGPMIVKELSRIPHIRDQKIVLSLSEAEIVVMKLNLPTISEHITNLHSNGYQLALVIQDATLTLPSDFYASFDYFIINKTLTARIKSDERQRMQLSSVLEKLIKYAHPLIISDLDNWQAIELVIQMGMNFVSADEIHPRQEMITPVDRKKLTRLSTFIE